MKLTEEIIRPDNAARYLHVPVRLYASEIDYRGSALFVGFSANSRPIVETTEWSDPPFRVYQVRVVFRDVSNEPRKSGDEVLIGEKWYPISDGWYMRPKSGTYRRIVDPTTNKDFHA